MSDKIGLSVADVRHLARLARIELSEDEVALFQHQLTEVIDYNMSLLATVDVLEVAPTAQVVGLTNVWQEDQPEAGLAVEVALSQAPRSRHNQFVVPQVLAED
jgi:aspartyl-tRNA(Asn)/glutamyl-tRNA(Gln) amidotransferase subunit C